MFEYCGWCYVDESVYPFGLCKKCWIKYGKPQPMNVKGEAT